METIVEKIKMTQEVEVDKGYELYQIIKDFDNPSQIFREAFQNSVDEDATKIFCSVFIDKKLASKDFRTAVLIRFKKCKIKNLFIFCVKSLLLLRFKS